MFARRLIIHREMGSVTAKKSLGEHRKYWINQRQLYADPICHFRNEKGSGAEMLPAIILFLGWLLGTHCSAIGQFFPCP